MRIIGGKYKGRKLFSPKEKKLRPTSEKTREAIFNILTHSIGYFSFEEAKVIDLFCGTGALGLEALSRGAVHIIFMDTSQGALNLTKKNAKTIGESTNTTIVKGDARCRFPVSIVENFDCDLAFLDAPYNRGLSLSALVRLKESCWLKPKAIVIVEIAKTEYFTLPKNFGLIDSRDYGSTSILFLEYDLNN